MTKAKDPQIEFRLLVRPGADLGQRLIVIAPTDGMGGRTLYGNRRGTNKEARAVDVLFVHAERRLEQCWCWKDKKGTVTNVCGMCAVRKAFGMRKRR